VVLGWARTVLVRGVSTFEELLVARDLFSGVNGSQQFEPNFEKARQEIDQAV
jgi:hypothetical protein